MRRLPETTAAVEPARPPAAGVTDRTKARILRQRPYHPWHLIPLAAMLCEEGYSDHSRGAIMDEVETGHCLDFIVSIGLLEPVDLVGAGDALDAGRRPPWSAELDPDAPLIPPELDPDDDTETDDAANLDRRIRELVAGWEPFHPEGPADEFEGAVLAHHAALQVWLTFFPSE